MATWKSNTYDGRYMRLTITETIDPINNKSTLAWTLESIGGNSTYYTIGTTTVKINGTQVYYKAQTDWDDRVFPAKKGSVSGTIDVTHNSDGAKTINVDFSTRVYIFAPEQYGGEMTLTTIDRGAPTVTLATTPVSASSFTIKATASTNCDVWEYSLNDGSWTSFSTTDGSSASKTLTGLSTKTHSIKVRARRTYNHVYGTSAAASCDIVLPTITLATSSITANSVYISASSNVNCNIWDYSIDDGSTWTRISTTNGTSATKTISGLTPNTEYKIKVRARKTANNLYGTSSISTIKTLGGTVLNSVSDLTIDAAAPVLALNWTVYDANYTHTLTIKNGNTVVLTVTGVKGSVGTNNNTYSFTAAERTKILNAMAALASFKATFEVATYSGTTQIGTTSSATATIKTVAANSAPTHGGFSYSDINATTVGITGSNALFVQSKSSLRVVFKGGTAKNGASISSYKVTIGSKVVSSATTTVDFGAISVAGEVTLTATVTDSRGWTATQTITLPVIEFTGISINSWATRRVNEVEEMEQLELVGTLSPVYVDDVPTNALQSLQYRFKKVSATSWSQYYDVSGVEKEDDRFTVDNDAFATFDPEYSWDLQIRAADKLSTYTITIVVPKGTPLVAYRSRKVGINNNNPQSALDVNGEIMQNGYVVMGFVSVLDDYTTFNNVKGSGIYWYNSSTAIANAPANEDGFLEVVCFGAITLHRFTGVSGAVVSRIFNTKWSTWN